MKRDVELSSPWERGEPSFDAAVAAVHQERRETTKDHLRAILNAERARRGLPPEEREPRPCSLCAHYTPWTQPSLAHLGECDRDHSTGAGGDTCAGWEANQ